MKTGLSTGKTLCSLWSTKSVVRCNVRKSSICEICDGQNGTEADFFSECFSLPLSLSFHKCATLISLNAIRKTSRRCLENSTLSKLWERWTQKDHHIPFYKALTDRCILHVLSHLLSRLQTYTFTYACLTKTKTSDTRQTGFFETEEAPRRLWHQWSNSVLHKIWLWVPERAGGGPRRQNGQNVCQLQREMGLDLVCKVCRFSQCGK